MPPPSHRDDSSGNVLLSHLYEHHNQCIHTLIDITANGRVYFTAPKLFEASLCLRGAGNNDGWFFVGLKFLIRVTGDMTGTQGALCGHVGTAAYLICYTEFPTVPTGPLKRFITDEADAQLSRYLPIPEDAEIPPPAVVPVERPRLPEGAADTPLARVFNFLRRLRPSLTMRDRS